MTSTGHKRLIRQYAAIVQMDGIIVRNNKVEGDLACRGSTAKASEGALPEVIARLPYSIHIISNLIQSDTITRDTPLSSVSKHRLIEDTSNLF